MDNMTTPNHTPRASGLTDAQIARECAENIICIDTFGTSSMEDINAFTALILAAITEATAGKEAEIARLNEALGDVDTTHYTARQQIQAHAHAHSACEVERDQLRAELDVYKAEDKKVREILGEEDKP